MAPVRYVLSGLARKATGWAISSGPRFRARPRVRPALTEFASGERWRLVLPEEIAHPKDAAHPLVTFVQPLTLQDPDAAALPGTYVLTIEPETQRDDFSEFADRARAREWATFELSTGHTPQRTMPRELVDILLTIR